MSDFSKTINLPSTSFSMKANLSQTENLWIDFWKEKNIYKSLKEKSSNFRKYILHDGPPYANGDLHLGHALNKILKDIVCRTKFQDSFDVNFIPGWDCHGLPIEWKVEEKFRKSGKKKAEISLEIFREECRRFAGSWVEKQKDQFARFGIQTDWEKIYLTMTNDAEVSIVEELLKFLESKELYLGFKPVMWSVVEQTALAEAEIEYHEKISRSIYVKFPTKNYSENTSVVIWTTTPWTIPCNRALAFSPNLKYQILEINEDIDDCNLHKGEKLILSESLVNNFVSLHKIKKFKVTMIDNDLFGSIVCSHPLRNLGYNFNINLFPSSHVTDDTGSGFVHIAPNHGLEDFEVGQKFNLDNISTVDEKGLYTKEIPFFNGLHIFKADIEVIKKLEEEKNLISNNDFSHSYPHSWRSKAPLIFRATSQWFISMEKKNLRDNAIKEIEMVKWVPENSKNRILSMVKDRPDWCVSRQRSWGVPITIFLSKKDQKPLIDKNVNSKIVSILKKEGLDSWFKKPNEVFITEKYDPSDFEKVDAILDVWFDSGSSHVYVLKNEGIKNQADLYLEGSDQHRGWFQTSLLESCAIYGKSPYKSVLTHGFVIDEKGKKMSKSLGNVILPSDVIKKYGADILRIWVASSNYFDDIRISYENLDRHAESYRKIRNTIRFLLGNLQNWDKNKNVDHKNLPKLEQYICHRLFEINSKVNQYFEEFNFNKAFQLVLSFCSKDLSAFFFDIRKDSLYCDSQSSNLYNSTQTVMLNVFECLIIWLAPIIPFTTEEAWQCWRREIDRDAELSCHLLSRKELPKNWKNNDLEKIWNKVSVIKDAFSFSVEKKRNLKEIKSSLEAKASIYISDQEYLKVAKSIDLNEILIASEVSITEKKDENFDIFPENNNLAVKIQMSDGKKCPRCWKIFLEKVESQELCSRCKNVIDEVTHK